ncbi:MAG TPA: DNA primase, partial [Candidatus Sulfotelmatobacter sp.]|nr:DNA primase [Candidatus Sulfotelmatobacter sp.]
MIDRQKIDEIRAKSNIVQVISEYVTLKKRGRNYLGLCPFHSEKDASFTVSEEKQLFHCFGCGEGGNVFAFLMKIENIGFAEAVAELGGKVGVAVGKVSSGVSKGEKDKLYDILNLANKFFVKSLNEDGGRAAREYFEKRGIRKETAEIFSLGYAPDAWDNLFKHLISRGAAPLLIEQAGLTLPRENQDGYYDRFRDRLMFPVADSRGRVIAFSGRAQGDKEPKYLNSPDTPVYHKGETVFGLAVTKEEIKKAKSAILVEGNVDLLSVYQAGFKNVAAPLGTALTPAQCKLLARLTDTILLAYDSDPAGASAAERSAEIMQGQGLKVKIVEIKGAKDPDELIVRGGPAAFRQALDAALPFLEFKIGRSLARFNLAEIEGRAAALQEVAKVLATVADSFTQKEYARLAAAQLKTDAEVVLAEIKRRGYYRPGRGADQRRVTEKPQSKLLEAEKHLLALALHDQAVRATIRAQVTADELFSAEAKAIAGLLFSAELATAADPVHLLLEQLADEAAKNYLTQIAVGENPDNAEQVLNDCLGVIKSDQARNRVDELKAQIAAAEQAGEAQKVGALLIALK